MMKVKTTNCYQNPKPYFPHLLPRLLLLIISTSKALSVIISTSKALFVIISTVLSV